jgi:tellurite resistance protein TerA
VGIDYNKRPSSKPSPAEPPAGGGGPINYSKRPATKPSAGGAGPVSLTKRGQTVSLKKGAGGGPVRINLNWDQQPAGGGGGLFRKRSGGIDLDLGCLYELSDGSKGAVQALGGMFGSLTSPPYVQLDKDDRSGTATDGENLLISGAHSAQISRLAVFAFIYEGAPNWSKAGGIVTIHPPQGSPVTIELDETRDGMIMCGICLVRGGSDGFTVQREVQYLAGHRALDQLYGWGMSWTRGSK